MAQYLSLTILWSRISNEIWHRIFDYLSPCRSDVVSCRHVCRLWAEIGSEHLITYVVVAKDSGSLKRLWDILEHPKYSLSVREIIYDASKYSEAIASDDNTYNSVCHKLSPRKYLFRGTERRRNNLALLALRIQQFQGLDESDSRPKTSGDQQLNILSGSLEYRKRWLEQLSTVRKLLHFKSLRCALRLLPKVRMITYTDFRYLAMPDESYLDLCQRLFGNVVEPNGLNLASKDGSTELLAVMTIVSSTAGHGIQSFTIGGHPFGNPEMNRGRSLLGARYLYWPWNRAALPHNFFRRKTFSESDPESDGDVPEPVHSFANADLVSIFAFKTLKRLCIPIRVPFRDAFDGFFDAEEDLPGSHLRIFLQCNMATITHLEMLAIEDYVYEEDEESEVVVRTAYTFSATLLNGLMFDSLHYLEMRNWRFREGDVLREFFARHAATLREVRLVECILYCTEGEGIDEIAEWVGQNLSLTGVDIELDSDFFRIFSGNRSTESDEEEEFQDLDVETGPREDQSEDSRGSRESNGFDMSAVETTRELSPRWNDPGSSQHSDLFEGIEEAAKVLKENDWLAGRRNHLLPFQKPSEASLARLLKDSAPDAS